MEALLGGIVFLAQVVAVIFLFLGETIYRHLPQTKNYLRISSRLESAKIVSAKFLDDPYLKVVAGRPLADTCESAVAADLELNCITFVNALEIVRGHWTRYERTLKELRLYCITMIALFSFSLLMAASRHDFKVDLYEMIAEVGRRPFEYLGLLEIVMIGVICVRFTFEVMELDNFLGK